MRIQRGRMEGSGRIHIVVANMSRNLVAVADVEVKRGRALRPIIIEPFEDEEVSDSQRICVYNI